MKTVNQVILNESGHSFLGFWTRNEAISKKLNHILSIITDSKNRFFVLDTEGTVRAAQPELHNALKYMKEDYILVHNQDGFIPFLGWTESQIPTLLRYEERIKQAEEYTEKVWEKVGEMNHLKEQDTER